MPLDLKDSKAYFISDWQNLGSSISSIGITVTKLFKLISSLDLFKNKLVTFFIFLVSNYKSVNMYFALAILANALLFLILAFFSDNSGLNIKNKILK